MELWPHQGGLDERDRGLGANESEAVERIFDLSKQKMCKSEMEHAELSKTKPASNLQLTFWKIFDNLTTIPGQDIPFPMLLETRFCKQKEGASTQFSSSALH